MNDAFEHEGVPPDLAEAFGHAGPPAQVGEFPAFSDPGSDPGSGLRALHAAIDAQGPLDRVSGLSTRLRWALAGSLLFGLVVVVLVATRRADLAVYPPERMALDLLVMLGPLALALRVALRPLSRPALSMARRSIVVVAGLVGVGIVASMPMAHALHPASLEGAGEAFFKRAVGCFGFGLCFAALATLGMGLLSRNGAKRWLPGALGVWAAGLVGLVALYFHCPITHPEHLWAGHATVALPVLAMLWTVRRRLDG